MRCTCAPAVGNDLAPSPVHATQSNNIVNNTMGLSCAAPGHGVYALPVGHRPCVPSPTVYPARSCTQPLQTFLILSRPLQISGNVVIQQRCWQKDKVSIYPAKCLTLDTTDRSGIQGKTSDAACNIILAAHRTPSCYQRDRVCQQFMSFCTMLEGILTGVLNLYNLRKLQNGSL